MRKRISFKTRRPDLSRPAFRDHYESRHVPLGLSFIDRFGWRRYVRNHVQKSAGTPIHFDCYAEFWVDDDFDDRSLEDFIRSPEFRVLDADDERFLDVTKRLSFEVFEAALMEPRDDESVAAKVAIVWTRGAGSRDDAGDTARRIIDAMGARVLDATLDSSAGVISPTPSATPSSASPFDTLLTLRLGDTQPVVVAPSVAPDGRWSVITVEPIETPPHLLFRGNRADTQNEEERCFR